MLTFSEIIEATGGRLLYGGATAPCVTEPNGITGVSIDSRSIKGGELFIAIKGERFDGHDFLKDALLRASGAIVSIPPAEPPKGKVVIRVENTVRALQDMAAFMRKKSGIPVVAVTGTNGKTTTKEMTAVVLGKKFRIHKSTGNLNNQIGLPLSLLKLGGEDGASVLEMGASMPGDIRELCAVARPDCGVLTNIGHAHLAGFKDIETIRRTKLELLEFVGSVVVNADDEYLMDGVRNAGFGGRVIRYALRNVPADVYASDIALGGRGSSFLLHIGERQTRVSLKVAGNFNIHNALAAASVGMIFNVDIEAVKDALEAFEGVPMRVEIKEFDGATVISDVYNANPASMEEAVHELVRLRGVRAIAVLGDMLELGSYAEPAHRKLGAWMSMLPIDMFIAVGPLMSMAAAEFKGESIMVADASGARDALLKVYGKGDVILIKGSRGMGMENVLNGANARGNGKEEEKVAV